jgi:hypothetical protein
MKRDRSTDKYTGKKLVPIQAWVTLKTHTKLRKEANQRKITLRRFVEDELEKVSNKTKEKGD